MAINKKLIHFKNKSTFNSKKLSANEANTQYQVGGTGTVTTGAPDINYQSIVYIKDSKEIWTHGQFYATAVTWSTITGKPSFATVATSGSYNDLNNKPTIPTSLPTPNSLTFTGATTGTWNGSAAKTVNIPTYSNASTSSAGLMSASDKSKLNDIASGAEVNQNAFSNVVVGSTTIAANSKTDTLTLTAGSNITLTPNATNDSITISASGSSYSLPLASNSTRGGIKLSSSTQGGTPNGITTTSGRTYAVQVNSNEQAVVNVPWTDTKYTLPTASASTLGGVKVGSGLAISNGVLSATGGGEADSVAWGNVTGKPSWIGSSKPTYTWSEITSKPTLVIQVEPGTPSTDWQSAYVPLDITYSDTSISHKVISLPMATPASGSSQGRAGLITGADKKKLDDLSTGVSNMIKSREAYVKCDTSTDDISLHSPEVITLDTTMTTITSTNTIFNGGEDVTFNNSGTLNVNCDAILTEHLTIGGVNGPERRTLYLHGDLTQDGGDASFTGTVSADGGFFDTSDVRVKANVRELNAINADAIKLVEFDRTDIEHHGYGVIAQEVEKVYPSVVNTGADGFKSVNYSEIAMIKIKSLEDKVARLEALVAKLESKLS